MKAISLFSGGLDSILATRFILEQGIDVEAVYFHNPFCDCNMPNASCKVSEKASRLLGIPLHKIELGKEYLDMVRDPKYGYGKNINPCIDCRILQFKRAKLLMKRLKASFIITGEVLNERPMSQRKEVILMMDKAAGLEGFILRPLSAKRLKETVAEKKGTVDRERLLDIQGRSRKTQMELAEKFGIGDYPTPSGGCLLTYEGFSDKVRDLIRHDQLNLEQARLLKLGRHFRLSDKAKFILGRDEKENDRIFAASTKKTIFLRAKGFPGPWGILPDGGTKDLVRLAASILSYYINKAPDTEELQVSYWQEKDKVNDRVSVKKITKSTLEEYRITK